MTRAIIVLSGGQDSTTCLFWAKGQFDELAAVTINYGQRHSREIIAAQQIAKMAGVPIEIINVASVLKSTSPLTDRNVELEQYKDWQSLPGGLEKTFVPMRNQFFLTLAANRAIAQGSFDLVTGVCQEDFGGYPDCRRVFIEALAKATSLGLDQPFRIHTPLMDLTKAESVKLALALPGCYEALAYSHTAYDGQYPPLGNDHATLLRAKGFEQADVPDPLILRAFWEMSMELPSTPNYVAYASQIRTFRSVFAVDGCSAALCKLKQEFR